MADSVWGLTSATDPRVAPARPRHSATVRVTHWITTLCFLALLVSGVEILLSHPRFYWGEAGNVGMTPLFKLPLPASRGTVPTGYGYVLHDQNGWSRALHFQSAWLVVIAGLLYVGVGLLNGHFRRNLLGSTAAVDGRSYNVLQRLTYLGVIFVLFPLVIWTGLAMSPGIAASMPVVVTTLGGQQTARTLHFFVTVLLVLFLAVHILKVYLAGFRARTGEMITGRVSNGESA